MVSRIETPESQGADSSYRASDARSLVDLVRELRDESSHLLRQEVRLAKAEMSEKAEIYGRNAGYLVAGAAVATAAILFFCFALMVGIYNGLVAAGMSHAASGWVAPFITGTLIGLLGYALVRKAISTFKHESPIPEQTVDTMEDNRQWIKEKVQK